MDMNANEGTSLNQSRQVAETIFPENAELLANQDWVVLSNLVEKNTPPNKEIVEPVGEAKDAFVASLIILYWTMKIAQIAIEIANEVKDLHGKEKAEAILKSVLNRIDPSTPQKVVGKVRDIVAEVSRQ